MGGRKAVSRSVGQARGVRQGLEGACLALLLRQSPTCVEDLDRAANHVIRR